MSLLSQAPVTRPLTLAACLFVPSIFSLTRPPTRGSLLALSQESAGKRRRQRQAKGTRKGGKRQGNAKKILNSGNKLKNVLKTKELAIFWAKNKVVFECKQTRIKPKKGAKKRLFVGHRTGIRDLKDALGWASTRGATRASNLTSPGMRKPPGAEPRSGAGDRSRQM